MPGELTDIHGHHLVMGLQAGGELGQKSAKVVGGKAAQAKQLGERRLDRVSEQNS
jgi:hypothetical protein